MKKVKLYSNNDWYCPHCGSLNNSQKPEKTVQCSWCLKSSKKITGGK